MIQEGAVPTIVARNEVSGRALAAKFEIDYQAPPSDARPLGIDFDIIVNTTPLGTAGNSVNFAILEASQLEGIKLVYDLVYNPAETTLIREANAVGVPAVGGIEMLLSQGARQFEIWTGKVRQSMKCVPPLPNGFTHNKTYAATSLKLPQLRSRRVK